MNKGDRDIFDELFRSKLENFESDIVPEDWEAIANRLPVQKQRSYSLRQKWHYWTAAAAIALLFTIGTFYISTNYQPDPLIVELEEKAEQKFKKSVQKPIEESKLATTSPTEESSTPTLANVSPRSVTSATASQTTITTETISSSSFSPEEKNREEDTIISILPNEENSSTEKEEEITSSVDIPSAYSSYIADATPVKTVKQSSNNKKWGFGMGAGSLSTGSENTIGTLTLMNSSSVENEELLLLNAPIKAQDLKTNVKHKTPVSVGLSASYLLNNRFALQSGINYSMLSSTWDNETVYHSHTRQKLHFIGVPLNLSYKIAEWNQIQLYAAAGGQVQFNVAGQQKTKLYQESKLIEISNESITMNKPVWSVNARAGVSYPIIRFVSAFAEVGGAYYFDNGSDIESVYSEKPFNVSFNFGLRLGF